MSWTEFAQRMRRLKAPGYRLTETQKAAIIAGSPLHFTGAKESGVAGHTMQGLARRGLAQVELVRKPHERLVYRLTEAGGRLRAEWEEVEEERALAAGFAPRPLAELRYRAAPWDKKGESD